MSISLRQNTNPPKQEELTFDRWHNTLWIEKLIPRVNGIVQTDEYVTEIYAEYVPFADDSNGKRHFKNEAKITATAILEDVLPTLPLEALAEAQDLVLNSYKTDLFMMRYILKIENIDLELS